MPPPPLPALPPLLPPPPPMSPGAGWILQPPGALVVKVAVHSAQSGATHFLQAERWQSAFKSVSLSETQYVSASAGSC